MSASQRAVLMGVLLVGAALRLTGTGWNLEHHSVVPTTNAPTFHVDEADFANGLRDDFRLFNEKSIVMDGPLVSNIAYWGVRFTGESNWDAALPLRWGRAVSAVADALSLLVLWFLLRRLNVYAPVALFAVALLAVHPNYVYNAHFARTHSLANFFQVVVLVCTAVMLQSTRLRTQAGALFVSGLCAILAGSARYPFLSLGLFPAWAMVALLLRARREGTLRHATLVLGLAAGLAVVLGLWLGFQFQPLDILRRGAAAQASADWQLRWSQGFELLKSAGRNVQMLFLFPARWPVALFLLCVPAASRIPGEKGARPHRLFVIMVTVWTLAYVVLWAKYSIPWQRYSMPVVTSALALGAVGMSELIKWRGWQWSRLSTTTAVLLLASPAFLSGLVAHHCSLDETHPLYQVSAALEKLPQTSSEPRKLYVHQFWNWNTPLFDLVSPQRFQLEFVPDMATLCAKAQPGDVILNLVFERLNGACDDGWTAAPIFAADNLGPPGYPYPEGYATTEWVHRHYDDSQYLFQEVTLLKFPARPVGHN